eukprot:CAMPEP_0197178590 /NCGR_PEP_ID=MMETSP1423-20130617/3820_1 /TAXON_ID=476441 /ORGANISM="Pseudo-nitzschia heimii, Strain UNC1101" /LENGTH=430 /DNA_ID=CAMNT_0042628363 /DNA_START=365 /DNA_END=1657 /DNA_ORIENTATION=+
MAPGGTGSGTSTTGANGSNSNSTFDLNDFPSLGGTVVMQGASNSDGSNNNSSNNGVAAALRDQQRLLAHHNQQLLQQQGGSNPQQQQQANSQQQKQQQQQQQQNNLYRLAMQGGSNGNNFNMATEDFPALPGAPPPSSSSSNAPVGAGSGDLGTSGSSSLLMGGGNGGVINASQGGSGLGGVGSNVGGPSRLAVAGGIYGGNDQDPSTDGPGLLGGGGPGLGVVNLSQQQQQQNQSNSRTKTDSTPAGTALSGDYGLLGLLGVIRMTDADRNALALGSDLTMLGLNLGSSEHIYNTFSGPWSESSGKTKEPHYQLPDCYYMQPPALKTGHLQQFQPETLFYIFYALPKDVLQAYAAQELYTREWRYHGDLKLWFKRAGPADGIAQSSAGQQYLYFDINSWEKRLFNGSMNQNVTGGFLTDDDVRVRFPST